jgi:hypothetical protein
LSSRPWQRTTGNERTLVEDLVLGCLLVASGKTEGAVGCAVVGSGDDVCFGDKANRSVLDVVHFELIDCEPDGRRFCSIPTSNLLQIGNVVGLVVVDTD